MGMPSVSIGQAQVIIGIVGIGIALYAIYQSKDTIAKAANATGAALNPTKDTNLAYKGAAGLFGEDFVTDKVGGTVAKIKNVLSGDDKKTPVSQTAKAKSASTTVKKIDQTKAAAQLFPFVKDIAPVQKSGGIVHG